MDEAALFGGENPSTIDGKGRVCIPARYREILSQLSSAECFVLTKAAPVDMGDGCFGRGLSAYTFAAWQEIKNKLLKNEGGFTSSQLNAIKRQLINPAEQCSIDKLGRILIPTSLRSHASLERDIWFVGMGQRFDIWSKETYSRVTVQDEKNFPNDSEALAEMGI